MPASHDPDRHTELHYYVTVKTLGHPDKARRNVGLIIAKLLALNFHNYEVRVGGPKGNKVILGDMDRVGAGEA